MERLLKNISTFAFNLQVSLYVGSCFPINTTQCMFIQNSSLWPSLHSQSYKRKNQIRDLMNVLQNILFTSKVKHSSGLLEIIFTSTLKQTPGPGRFQRLILTHLGMRFQCILVFKFQHCALKKPQTYCTRGKTGCVSHRGSLTAFLKTHQKHKQWKHSFKTDGALPLT